jgi:NAD(P)H-flavin reductase
VTVDSAGREWRGRVGVVTKLIDAAAFDPGSAVAMTCGPEVMMRFAVEALLGRGVAPARAFVSMERNMQCGIGHCGHCQLGPTLVCRDGPVYTWEELEPWLAIREL